MIKKILKKIASLICPASSSLAYAAAEGIATGYNSVEADKRELVAYYSNICKKMAAYQAKIDAIVADGVIDKDEVARIATAIEPLIAQARELVFK